MKAVALIEKGKDGTYGIFTPDLNATIIGEGKTVEEAKKDFENSLNEVLESYEGEELPDELKDLEIIYKFDLESLFEYFDWINVSKFAEVVGINASVMRQYKQGLRRVTEAQAKKIEEGLHKMGEELLTVSL